MIDLVYSTVLTIINKENSGYVSPTEFNILANTVQDEIFRSYFITEGNYKIKGNRFHSTSDFNERQRINQFSSISTITKADNKFTLPVDLYFIEKDGVTSSVGNVIEEVEKNTISYLKKSISAPTTNYPVYESYGNNIIVSPDTINTIDVRYLRKPKAPKWTYFLTPSGSELFDPSNPSFQDFELHESEFPNIVNKILRYFGINLREGDIVQIAETLNDKLTIKENS